MRDLINDYLVDNWSPAWEIEYGVDLTDLHIMTDLELFIFFMQATELTK